MVLVAVLTSAGDLLAGTPEVVLSSCTFSTFDAQVLDQQSILATNSVPSMSAFFLNILEQMGIRSTTQIVLGLPSHVGHIFSTRLRASIIGSGKVSNLVVVDSALLAAYGCAKSTCLVTEVYQDGGQLVYSVAPVIDYATLNYQNSLSQNLVQAVKECLGNVDADKHPILLDNLIVTGPAWSVELEAEVINALRDKLATVSSYPSDHQIRAINTRHIPDYHSDLLKTAGPQSQKNCAIFGAAISCKAFLSEMGK